jgi:hypothetical protein
MNILALRGTNVVVLLQCIRYQLWLALACLNGAELGYGGIVPLDTPSEQVV